MVQCVDSWDIDVVWGDVIADNKKWLIRNDYPTSLKQGRCKIFECFCHSRCLCVFPGFSWWRKVLPWDSPRMLWVFSPFDFCYCEHSQKYWRRLSSVGIFVGLVKFRHDLCIQGTSELWDFLLDYWNIFWVNWTGFAKAGAAWSQK